MEASLLYTQHLVGRITKLWDFSFLNSWNADLRRMNASKVGRPFIFPTPFILFLALIKVAFHMTYRDLEGMIIGLASLDGRLKAPDYTTIFRRVERLSVEIMEKVPRHILESIRQGKAKVAVDSTGISVTIRGEWLRYKHKDGKIKCRKGFLKLHIAIAIKTGTILGMEVTDEFASDSAALPSIIEQAVQVTNIGVLYGDGAYPTYENYNELEKRGIEPVLKPPCNARILHSKQGYVAGRRSLYAKEIRYKGYDYWKVKHSYGNRWLSECGFSSFKRRFGESVMSRKPGNMVKEVQLKVMAYNMFTDWPRSW